MKTEHQNKTILGDIAAMREVLTSLPQRDLYGPVQFWDTIGEKHLRLIEQSGFENFKRTINFEYNQWGVSSFRDKKISNLLARLFWRGKIPWGWFFKTRLNQERWTDARWPDDIDHAGKTWNGGGTSSDISWKQRAYGLYLSLLWQYVLTEDHLGILRSLEEPALGAPLPITQGGRTISQDLAMSTLELNIVARWVDLSKVQRVAEIGAGYGRLAYVFLKYRPQLEYNIFDIPPALAVSQIYLAGVFGDNRVAPQWRENPTKSSAPIRICLAHQLEYVPDGSLDLMINISSFDEMAFPQVENYFALIERKCRGWVYLKGHALNRGGNRSGLSNFPYRRHWKLLYHAPDPFVSTFEERIYKL